MPNPNEYYVYIAKPFDTALAVALRFGVTEQQLRDANPQWRNRIVILLKAGEEVILPAGVENSPMFFLYKFQLVVRQRKTADKNEAAADSIDLPAGLKTLTADLLLKINPNLRKERAEELFPYLNRAIVEAQIATLVGEAMFLAQVLHEIGTKSNLNEGGGKKAYKGKVYDYFFYMYDKGSPNPDRQRKAAELGNDQPGDGAKYHGRGYIQLTGKTNYKRAGKYLVLDLVNTPDLANIPKNSVLVAGWFWRFGNGDLNKFTDTDSDTNFQTVTKRINGGLTHYAERKTLYTNAKKVLGVK